MLGKLAYIFCYTWILIAIFLSFQFSLPTVPLPVLPWSGNSKSTVADMLQAKIRNLSTRPLTEDDLLHLRDRLLSKIILNHNNYTVLIKRYMFVTFIKS